LRERLGEPERLFQQVFPHLLHLGDVGQVDHADLAEHRIDRLMGEVEIGLRPLVLPPDLPLLKVTDGGDQGERERCREDEGGERADGRPVPAAPTGEPDMPGLAVGGDRLVGDPAVEVVGQVEGAGVSVRRVEGHGLATDGVEGTGHRAVDLSRRGVVAPPDVLEDFADGLARKRGSAGQDRVEGRPQAVDVAGRAELLPIVFGLLRAHVGRSADRTDGGRPRPFGAGARGEGLLAAKPRVFVAVERAGQAPVDDQRLVVLVQHHVLRFDVTVQDAPAVRIGDRVADGHQPFHQQAQSRAALGRPAAALMEAVDLLFQRLAADEPHRVTGVALVVLPQAVDGHDPRVFEPPGDLGLHEEPAPALGIACPPLLEELQGHLAVQVLAERHENLAQPPRGVELQVTEGRGA